MSLTLQVACVLEREKEKTLIVRILIDLILQEACVKYALERVIALIKKSPSVLILSSHTGVRACARIATSKIGEKVRQ